MTVVWYRQKSEAHISFTQDFGQQMQFCPLCFWLLADSLFSLLQYNVFSKEQYNLAPHLSGRRRRCRLVVGGKGGKL